MRYRSRRFALACFPLLAFLVSGAVSSTAAAQGGVDPELKITYTFPAMCDATKTCVTWTNTTCVDVGSDGDCDYTEIPWEPVD
jgi:hypothetical protein